MTLPGKWIRSTVVVCAALAAIPLAYGDEPEWRSWDTGDRLSVELYGFYLNSNTDVKLEAEGYEGLGLFVNLEDLLGVEEHTWTPVLSVNWRLTRKGTLYYNYFDLDRDGLEDIDIELGTIDGVPFGPVIETTFDLESHILTWNYSVFFEPTYDFFLGAGLAMTKLDLSLVDREGWLDPVVEDFEAPVPAFTFGYDWVFADNWVWRNAGSFLALSLSLDGDEASGHTLSFSTLVEWRALSHLSLTAGYEVYTVDAELKDSDSNLSVDFTYHGPRLGIAFRF